MYLAAWQHGISRISGTNGKQSRISNTNNNTNNTWKATQGSI